VPQDAPVGAELSIKVVTAEQVDLKGGHITIKVQPIITPVNGRFKVGETVELLGRGLGDGGRVILGGKSVAKFDWKPERIGIFLTNEIVTGKPLPIVAELADGTQLDGGAIVVDPQVVITPANGRYKSGDRIVIPGTGLGDNGKVYLNRKEVDRVKWSPESVLFWVPKLFFGTDEPLRIEIETADGQRHDAGEITIEGPRRKGQGMEFNTVRSGRPYDYIDLKNDTPEGCRDYCHSNDRCQSWTYFPPGLKGRKGGEGCGLYDEVLPSKPAADHVSGVKYYPNRGETKWSLP
jgi:hypothetical protein